MHSVLDTFKLGPRNPGTLGVDFLSSAKSKTISSRSPIDGTLIAEAELTDDLQLETVIESARDAFKRWSALPAPKRGDIIREIAVAFRENIEPLAKLVSWENGKILAEARGEIQELIDIADFAVGLSRQLYGKEMHSERAHHRMFEQWHPLGVIGVITAFNFPVAVWGWNAMIGAVCGNAIIWKPSELTPIISLATARLAHDVMVRHNMGGVFSMVTGTGSTIGARLAADPRIPLISATGSCAMGRSVSQVVAARLGRSLLELGGNNAVLVLEDCDLEMAARSIFFGSVGTAGQRCTTTRRVLVQKNLATRLSERLVQFYKQVTIGDPREAKTLMGPLISDSAVKAYRAAISRVESEGGKIVYGGKVLEGLPSRLYVEPTIVRAHKDMPLVREETFAPIVYLIEVSGIEEAIEINNSVSQGLSSAIFTSSIRSSQQFLAQTGSDCGIANVNIGTSGAEIGGAFGGEKETGGGREAGSDSWKAYMRRQTCTLNWGTELLLAQGIKFGE